MTTLVMGAILLFGIMGYRPAGERSAQRGFSHDPGDRQPARGQPRDMASSVATPLERQFSTIAGLDSMISTSGLGLTQITLPSPWTGTSTPPPRTSRRPSPRRPRQLPPDMPTPPSYQKVNPADQPVLYLALTSPTLPLSTVDEYARDAHGPAHLHGERRRPGAGLRLAEVRGAHPARSRGPGHRGDRDRRGGATRSQQGNVNLPTGDPVRAHPGVHGRRPTGSSTTPRRTGR